MEAALRDSLKLLAGVERQSKLLRSLGQPARQHRKAEQGLIASDLEDDTKLPIGVGPATGPARPDLPALKADAVRLGRESHRLRVRAVYVAAGLTVAIHGNMPWWMPNRLHRGTRVLERVTGRTTLVLPRPLEKGRGLRHAWLVEELLPGLPPEPDDWPAMVEAVLEGLWGIWTARRLREEPVRRHVRPGDISEGFSVLRALQAGGATIAAAQDAAVLSGQLVVGTCHGDPQPANVLRLPNGELGLIDWETATEGPIWRDAVKVLDILDDPLPHVAALAGRLESELGTAAHAWRRQLALGCLSELARNSRQQQRARRTQNEKLLSIAERRQLRKVRLLEHLFAAD